MRIFAGFDSRAPAAFNVCRDSLLRHASASVDMRKLDLAQLRADGLYTRPHEERDGRLWDVISEAPMSTEFALSRFLVPHLAGFDGWAVYCDADFLWRADVAELFALADDKYAVMAVKHQYEAQLGPKMNGQVNVAYPRKNWSSLLLWNCGHPANRKLTPELVSSWHRNALHGFQWLYDWHIGGLSFEWNWIQMEPKAVHFTAGTPDLPGYEDSDYADEYRSYLK